MINIKSFAKRKGVTTNSQTSSSSSSSGGTSSPVNDWFYLNTDNGFVTCRYDFASVGNIVANADGTEAGGGSTGGSGNVVIVDDLTSYETSYALSANQGRVLKSLIDNATTTGGGSVSSIDWANVTNKPSTFPPTSHTHSINDITGLQSTLNTVNTNIATNSTNLATHIANTSVHVTAQQQNLLSQLTAEQIQFLTQLMSVCTISNGTIQFTGNVHASGNVVALSIS